MCYQEGDNHAASEMILNVEKYINTTVFGEPEAPSNWQFPFEEGLFGDIKFANWRARRIIDELDQLVDICIPVNQMIERLQWRDNVKKYRDVIRRLHSGTHYSPMKQLTNYKTLQMNSFLRGLN